MVLKMGIVSGNQFPKKVILLSTDQQQDFNNLAPSATKVLTVDLGSDYFLYNVALLSMVVLGASPSSGITVTAYNDSIPNVLKYNKLVALSSNPPSFLTNILVISSNGASIYRFPIFERYLMLSVKNNDAVNAVGPNVIESVIRLSSNQV